MSSGGHTRDRPPSDQVLLDDLVPGPSLFRQITVFLTVTIAFVGLVTVPTDSFQDRVHMWRHVDQLGGEVRTIDEAMVGERRATVALGDGRVAVWPGRSSAHASIYDPNTGTWTDTAPAPIPLRADPAGVWTGSEAVFWGGTIQEGAYEVRSDGAAWNPTTNEWRTIPPAPLAMNAARATAFDNGVLFAGAEYVSPPADQPVSLWLDHETDTWTVVPTPIEVRNLTTDNARALATGPALQPVSPWSSYGGYWEEAPGWVVAAFDPASLTWEPLTAPTPSVWMVAATSAEGGINALSAASFTTDRVEALTWDGGVWTTRAFAPGMARDFASYSFLDPVGMSIDGSLVIGGSRGLVAWDPATERLSVNDDWRISTFNRTAVWTGIELVSPMSAWGSGWAWRPDVG